MVVGAEFLQARLTGRIAARPGGAEGLPHRLRSSSVRRFTRSLWPRSRVCSRVGAESPTACRGSLGLRSSCRLRYVDSGNGDGAPSLRNPAVMLPSDGLLLSAAVGADAPPPTRTVAERTARANQPGS